MLFRRFALAVGLLFAFCCSQLPEFVQQYRQRLGGAIDELSAIVAEFDAQASAQGVDRTQGIARLEQNGDALARERGESLQAVVMRRDRLDRQRTALATAGPFAEYAVLAEDFDTGLGRQAFADYRPAVPATAAGFVAGAVGLVIGWSLTHLVGLSMRRRARPVPVPAA